MNKLTFKTLRHANISRLPYFRSCEDWKLSAWSNAVLGELGEAANIIKKIERGDFTLDEARQILAKEFADVQTYLDILAYKSGIDLGRATVNKFNEVSDRNNTPIHLIESNVSGEIWLESWPDLKDKQ